MVRRVLDSVSDPREDVNLIRVDKNKSLVCLIKSSTFGLGLMMCLHRVANILKPHIGFGIPGYWYQFAEAPKSGTLQVSLKKNGK